jgi:hypothetical protein
MRTTLIALPYVVKHWLYCTRDLCVIAGSVRTRRVKVALIAFTVARGGRAGRNLSTLTLGKWTHSRDDWFGGAMALA